MDLEKLKYPIGQFTPRDVISKLEINQWIDDLTDFPNELFTIVTDLDETDLLKTYRPGGWNIKQVIHHLADSHVNAYTRVKLTLTEETPIIRPYFEEKWAELPDSNKGEVKLSLNIIQSIHARLVYLLKRLSENDFERKYIHPSTQQCHSLANLVGNYAWHGKHHIAHINLALL